MREMNLRRWGKFWLPKIACCGVATFFVVALANSAPASPTIVPPDSGVSIAVTHVCGHEVCAPSATSPPAPCRHQVAICATAPAGTRSHATPRLP
jgi:hypothetical protein